MVSRNRRMLGLLAGILLLGVTWLALAHAVQAAGESSADSMPDWLEPRGLGVAELVDQVPEEYLQGMIISYGGANGIVVYEAGSRVGNAVVLTTTIYPRVLKPDWAPNNLITTFNCLGQRPFYDHMGSVVPPSTLRVWASDGVEVTSEIDYMFITRPGTEQPLANSSAYWRYRVDEYGPHTESPVPLGPDGLAIPANGGCRIDITGADYYPLTGVFKYMLDPPVHASVVGTQHSTFHTYIGVGAMGIFEPLMKQMQRAYPYRHGRIPLAIPESANYFLVKFPPMAGDAFADSALPTRYNADRLTGGTYRLSGNGLSTNMIFSSAFPINPGWRDADQAPGTKYLPLLSHPSELTTPEYVLPSGIDYDNCFTQGNCPAHMLEQIYSTEMDIQIIYLSVDRLDRGGDWVPLRMAGPGWSSGDRSAPMLPGDAQPPTTSAGSYPEQLTQSPAATHRVYIPLLIISPFEAPPNNCLCGWFDSIGRMLYYNPGP